MGLMIDNHEFVTNQWLLAVPGSILVTNVFILARFRHLTRYGTSIISHTHTPLPLIHEPHDEEKPTFLFSPLCVAVARFSSSPILELKLTIAVAESGVRDSPE
jgi:hypothetical protein